MRTEIHDRQLDITALHTHLADIADPNSELRSHKVGRLYAKSGPRHAAGRSRSRLAYQAAGAEYLDRSVTLALRERKVKNAVYVCKSIMAAARPEPDRAADEPHRYRVRHARAMAQIIALAERPAARPLGFEAAALMAAEHWPHLSRLDDTGVRQWWEAAVRDQLAAARDADPKLADAKSQSAVVPGEGDALNAGWFERKDQPARLDPVPSSASNIAEQSAAQAQREVQTLWHPRPATEAPEERKHGPAAGRNASPTSVMVHSPPLKAVATPPEREASASGRGADRAAALGAAKAQGFMDSLLHSDLQVSGLVASLSAKDLPHLMPLLRKQADALTASADTPRNAKTQAQEQQAWIRLSQFCGEACIDDAAGEHAFTRAQVLQFPLNQRLNMLEAVVDEIARSQSPGPKRTGPQAFQDTKALICQLHGLMNAFSDKELLPPGDSVRVKAMRAQLQAILKSDPGAGFTPALASEVVKLHREVYSVDGKAVKVQSSPTLKQPFAFSPDRSTLHVSTAPRPASETTADVTRQLLVELARNYQQHLVRALSLDRLPASDDRYMLAVTLINCKPPAIDMELLGSGFDRSLPESAPTRHAALHARLALGH